MISRRTRGSLLVALLWCLALLSLVVIGVLHTSRMDLVVMRHYGDRIQAHYLARAGIEKAKALLYHDARERSRSAQSHHRGLYNDPEQFRDVTLGRGQFRVFRAARPDEGSEIIFGVSDEESRLNINTAEADDLGKLYAITPDVVAALIDWRDGDNAVTPSGAEADYYSSLQPPAQARNGAPLTVRELMMVRGVTRADFLGDDPHQTGLLEPMEEDGNDRVVHDTGWGGLLTVHSEVSNVSAAGQDRVNIQTADEAALTAVPGISADIARAIIAHRNQNRFESIVDLLDVGPPQNQNQNAGQNFAPGGVPGVFPGAPRGRSSGPKVIDETLFFEIADSLTVDDASTLQGVVNINTASVDVLICLPGVTREIAHAIVAYRGSSGFFPNIGYLLHVPGMTTDTLKGLARRITPRSETFRILSEGRITSSGVRQRLQEIVRVDLYDTETVAYREDDL